MQSIRTQLRRLGYDAREMTRRSLKYILLFLSVFVAATYIPKNKLDDQEIVMMSLIAACIFALIDMYSPSVRMQIEAKE